MQTSKVESNFIQALQSVHFYFGRKKINHRLFSPLLLFSCQFLYNLTRLPALRNCPSHSSLSVFPQKIRCWRIKLQRSNLSLVLSISQLLFKGWRL